MKPTGNPVGKPTRLTPAVQKVFLGRIIRGDSIEASAAVAGIGRRTVYDWLRVGHEKLALRAKHQRIDPKHEKFAEFVLAFEHAQGLAEARDLDIIDRLAQGGAMSRTVETFPIIDRFGEPVMDRETGRPMRGERIIENSLAPNWTSAAWKLERRLPARYARRSAEEAPKEQDDAPRQTIKFGETVVEF